MPNVQPKVMIGFIVTGEMKVLLEEANVGPVLPLCQVHLEALFYSRIKSSLGRCYYLSPFPHEKAEAGHTWSVLGSGCSAPSEIQASFRSASQKNFFF